MPLSYKINNLLVRFKKSEVSLNFILFLTKLTSIDSSTESSRYIITAAKKKKKKKHDQKLKEKALIRK
jgi:carbon starvation protein CstA